MEQNHLTLSMGDIVRVWWPHTESPKVAGPKLRPAIYLGRTFVEGNEYWAVAYGTSRVENRSSKLGTDFIIRCQDEPNGVLNTDTLFDFGRITLVPNTAEFVNCKRIAEIPAIKVAEAVQCMANAKVANTLKSMQVKV